MRLLAGILAAIIYGAAPPGVSAGPPPLRVCADPNNLPFSNSAGEGFENKLAALIAEQLGQTLEYVWRPQRRGFLREGLNAGACDLVTATPPEFGKILSTRPYYRSSYMFVSRPADSPVASLSDPRLRTLLVGVQLIGDDSINSPPAHALTRMGIIDNIRGYPVFGDYGKPDPSAAIVAAVASGKIDIAAVWGPTAGYYASKQSPPLVLRPIPPPQDAPIPMSFDISMAVRKTDRQLLEKIQTALNVLQPQISAVLTEYHVPIIP